MFDDFWCHDSWKIPSLFDKLPDIMGHHIPHHRRVLPWNQAANRCLLAVQGHVCCKLVACWWVPSSTHLTFPSSQEMRCKYEMQILYQKWKNVMLHPFQAIQTAVCAGLSVWAGASGCRVHAMPPPNKKQKLNEAESSYEWVQATPGPWKTTVQGLVSAGLSIGDMGWPSNPKEIGLPHLDRANMSHTSIWRSE